MADPLHPIKAGRLLTKKQIDNFRDNFKGTRKGEFFSKDLLLQLLEIEGCDGLGIFYGAAAENADGSINYDASTSATQPRLFVVPVTAETSSDGQPKGRERVFTIRVDKGKDGGDDYGGAGEGKPMPPF